MAKLLVKVFATEDRKEEGTLYSWAEERQMSEAALAKGKTDDGKVPKFAETWVAPDVDLSQYGWVKASDVKLSIYGNQLWVYPCRRIVYNAPDFPE